MFNGATNFNGNLANWQLTATNVNCDRPLSNCKPILVKDLLEVIESKEKK